MTGKRRRYSADFKAKVALEAVRVELTAAQPAKKYSIHQTMVRDWKLQAKEGLAAAFAERSNIWERPKVIEAEMEKLHAKIGDLLVERMRPATLSIIHKLSADCSTDCDICQT